MGIEQLRKHLEADRRRRRRGHRFFHASPFALKPGANLLPKWCRFQLWLGPLWGILDGPEVWLTTSLRKAQEIGRLMVDGSEDGEGFAGGVHRTLGEEYPLRGAWIYQVRPLGPLREIQGGHARTTHPARVLRVAATWGDPERNPADLEPPRIRDEEAARLWLKSSKCTSLDLRRLRESIRETWADDPAEHLRRFRKDQMLAERRSLDSADWRRNHDRLVVAFQALRGIRSERDAEARFRSLEGRWRQEELERLGQLRRKATCRRLPRRRYQREVSR